MLYVTGNAETRKVKINNKMLSPEHSLQVINHSPDGFAWGYGGSGPAQLALAILLTVTNEEDAQRLHQQFKEDYVMKFRKDKNFSYKVPVKRWLVKNGAKYTPSDADFTPYDPDKDNVGRACGSYCTTATTPECNCQCGGKNHGIANPKKVATTPTTQPTTEQETSSAN